MKNTFIITLLTLIVMRVVAAETSMPRERTTLDYGWRFHLGDIPFPVVTGHNASYNHAKAGTAQGAAARVGLNGGGVHGGKMERSPGGVKAG